MTQIFNRHGSSNLPLQMHRARTVRTLSETLEPILKEEGLDSLTILQHSYEDPVPVNFRLARARELLVTERDLSPYLRLTPREDGTWRRNNISNYWPSDIAVDDNGVLYHNGFSVRQLAYDLKSERRIFDLYVGRADPSR